MARERRTPDRLPVPTDWRGDESQSVLPPVLNLLAERSNDHDQELVDVADRVAALDLTVDAMIEATKTATLQIVEAVAIVQQQAEVRRVDLQRLRMQVEILTVAVGVEGLVLLIRAVTS